MSFLYVIAVHEAGHAVCMTALGYRWERLEASEETGGLCHYPAAQRSHELARAIVSLAGAAAQDVLQGRHSNEAAIRACENWRGDLAIYDECIAALPAGLGDPGVALVYERARAIIEARWSEVIELAERLTQSPGGVLEAA
jgi:hypothetical protein